MRQLFFESPSESIEKEKENKILKKQGETQ